MYTIFINCVDGETSYSMTSNNPKHILKFLEKYDHEGSSLQLDYENNEDNGTLDYDSDIYSYLKGEIDK